MGRFLPTGQARMAWEHSRRRSGWSQGHRLRIPASIRTRRGGKRRGTPGHLDGTVAGMTDIASLTREEAAERAALLNVERYDVHVDLRGLYEGDLWAATSTISFTCREPGREHVRRLRRRRRLGDPQRRGAGPVDRRARPPPAARPARRQRAGGVAHPDRHRTRAPRSCKTVDPHRQAGLRLVDASSPTMARYAFACFDQPDLKAPHGFVVDAHETLDGDQQLRARPGRGPRRRRAAAGAGRSATRRRSRRTSRSSTPARSTSCGRSAAATTSACSAGSRSSSSSSATPRSCSTSPTAGWRSSASASASRSRRSATTRCSCPTWAGRWRTGAR